MKKFILAILSAASFASFAKGDDNLAVLVSTIGPDRYRGGEIVMDGECYALVWSVDGVFEGFTADGSPMDENDRVVNVGAVARGGRCRAVFEVSADLASRLAGGRYAVYLLDTRVADGGVVKPMGLADGRLPVLNGYGVVAAGVTVDSGFAMVGAMASSGGVVAGAVAEAAEGVEQPKITRIEPAGENMVIFVKGLDGYMRVRTGATIDLAGGVTPAVATDASEREVRLVVPRLGASGFYRVIRSE